MRLLIALLAVAGIVISSLALRIHAQDPSAAPPCAVSEHWDCGVVNHSRYAVFPASTFDEAPGKFHVPVALLGIFGYALIAALALVNRLKLALPAVLIGFGFASYLTYLEKFVMEKWCIYCVWSMAIITVTLLATIAGIVLQSRHKRRVFAGGLAAAS